MIPLEFFGEIERTEVENMESVVDSERRNRGAVHFAIEVCGNLWKADAVGRNKRAVGDARHCARRRLDAVAHPCRERGQKRAHRPDLRVWVWLLLAIAKRRPGGERQRRRRMLGARHDVGADVRRIDDVGSTERIGQAERLASFPHFERSRDMKQFRTGVGRAAPIKQASCSLGQRIGLARIGEGEIVSRIKMVGLLAPSPHRLAKANVERHEAAANMREGSVEHASSRLVAVEAER